MENAHCFEPNNDLKKEGKIFGLRITNFLYFSIVGGGLVILLMALNTLDLVTGWMLKAGFGLVALAYIFFKWVDRKWEDGVIVKRICYGKQPKIIDP